MSNIIASEIVRRQEKLANNRSILDAHCEEIADRVLPRQTGSFIENIETKGGKKTDKMLDATPALALERFVAIMESLLTPRNSIWHRVRASNEALNRDRDSILWFEELNNLLFKARYSPRANYASQQYETYMSLGAFGTGTLFIDEMHRGPGIRYRSIHLGEIHFLENHQGVIDTSFRKFKMTARQAAQKWGEDKMPDKIKLAMKKDSEKEFEFIHCVQPREDYDNDRLDFKGMPFASYYVAKEEKTFLSEGGYQAFPYAISRYVTAPGEIYGRSPAMVALPSIKVLNEQKKTILKQGHRIVDPVILAHDDGIMDSFSLRPGRINIGTMSKDGKPLVGTLPTGDLAVGVELMEQERAVINDVFLVSLFQILVESPAMTATEVLERTREKGALLSPTMGRQQSEALGPMIEREIDILSRQGLLPPMPGLLLEAQGEYIIEYDSPLSRAQKAEEAAGMFRSIEFAVAHANVTQDPSAFDHIDIDVAMPEIMTINAVPERWKRSAAQIEEIRQDRTEQMQMDKMIEAAPAAAGLAKVAQQ